MSKMIEDDVNKGEEKQAEQKKNSSQQTNFSASTNNNYVDPVILNTPDVVSLVVEALCDAGSALKSSAMNAKSAPEVSNNVVQESVLKSGDWSGITKSDVPTDSWSGLAEGSSVFNPVVDSASVADTTVESGVADKVWGFFSNKVSDVGTSLTNMASTTKETLGGVVDGVSEVATGAVELASNVATGATNMAGSAVDTVSNVASGAVDIASSAVEVAGSVASGAAEVAGSVVEGVGEVVGGILGSL